MLDSVVGRSIDGLPHPAKASKRNDNKRTFKATTGIRTTQSYRGMAATPRRGNQLSAARAPPKFIRAEYSWRADSDAFVNNTHSQHQRLRDDVRDRWHLDDRFSQTRFPPESLALVFALLTKLY